MYELEEDQTHFHYIPPISFIINTTVSTCEITYGETPWTTINMKNNWFKWNYYSHTILNKCINV